MTSPQRPIACPGCGILSSAAPATAPPHPYIGASHGCWTIYSQVLGREYAEFGYPAIHRLTVDAYAAQHPGSASRRSIQSVAIHLLALHAAMPHLESPAAAAEAATRAIRRGLAGPPQAFHWLDPPRSLGAVTIRDVATAGSLAEHEQMVILWSRSVWDAWSSHHATIARWARAKD